MAIQPEEDTGAFDISFTRQVHAPVHVFIGSVIADTSWESAPEKGPMPRDAGDGNKRNDTNRDQHRAIPPGHRDRVFVLFACEMVARIGSKNTVVYQSVPLEWVGELSEGAMHKIFVQQPFEQGAENSGNQETGRHPKEDIVHGKELGSWTRKSPLGLSFAGFGTAKARANV